MNCLSDIYFYITENLKNNTLTCIFDNFMKNYPMLIDDIKLIFMMEYGFVPNNCHNRDYQQQLRIYAIDRFNNTCPISNINELKRLECAHIKPVSVCNDSEKRDVHNCILLWMDIHKYFDTYSLSINPNTFTVEINLDDDDNMWLKQYNGLYVNNLSIQNIVYLEHHYDIFKKLNS